MALLGRNRLARIACVSEGQPYIVPIHFACDEDFIYGLSTTGQKIDWLRNNPRACVEVDEIVTAEQWACVVVLGRFEEVSDAPEQRATREHAYDMLKQYPDWWVPPYLPRRDNDEKRPLDPIYFRISVDVINGRRSGPAVSESRIQP